MTQSRWNDVRWHLVLSGLADAWLWDFVTDQWRLAHGDPAHSMLGILPLVPGGKVASLEDATWLADVMSFDHDAP